MSDSLSEYCRFSPLPGDGIAWNRDRNDPRPNEYGDRIFIYCVTGMGKESSRENFSERSNVSAISVTIWKAFIQPSEKSPFSSGCTSNVFCFDLSRLRYLLGNHRIIIHKFSKRFTNEKLQAEIKKQLCTVFIKNNFSCNLKIYSILCTSTGYFRVKVCKKMPLYTLYTVFECYWEYRPLL